MSWLLHGVSYCRQIASRVTLQTVSNISSKQPESSLLNVQRTSVSCCSIRGKAEIPPYKFPAPSPYRTPGPGRYGYRQKFFDGADNNLARQEPYTAKVAVPITFSCEHLRMRSDGPNATLMLTKCGPLPRGLSEPIENLPKYRPRNVWNKKRATFGQNDYIDILGDSNLRPVDIIKAPAWLRGFNGNEMQRVVRRMHFEGHVIKQLYPTLHHNHWKRIKYLYKKYNQKRGRRI